MHIFQNSLPHSFIQLYQFPSYKTSYICLKTKISGIMHLLIIYFTLRCSREPRLLATVDVPTYVIISIHEVLANLDSKYSQPKNIYSIFFSQNNQTSKQNIYPKHKATSESHQIPVRTLTNFMFTLGSHNRYSAIRSTQAVLEKTS